MVGGEEQTGGERGLSGRGRIKAQASAKRVDNTEIRGKVDLHGAQAQEHQNTIRVKPTLTVAC